MKCQDIIDILQAQSLECYALEWDNVGLLVGDSQKEVQSVYIALDATEETIAEAAHMGAELLITHHPMIFKGLKKVNTADFTGRRVISLIKQDIACFAMHTNFDVKKMAVLAAEKMQLRNCRTLEVTCRDEEGTHGIGCVGDLPQKTTVRECASMIKQVFGIEQVKVFGSLEQEVFVASVCPGSGKSVIEYAVDAGADVLVTGDIDHHQGIDAAARGLAIIDAGHYGLEKMFMQYIEQYLKEHTAGLQIKTQPVKEPFVYL